MEVIKVLGVDDIENIYQKVKMRQDKFDEDLQMSIGVVLMNYGDSHVVVQCTNEEFLGTKNDLTPRDGIPLCPNGHPLYELSYAPKLALIAER